MSGRERLAALLGEAHDEASVRCLEAFERIGRRDHVEDLRDQPDALLAELAAAAADVLRLTDRNTVEHNRLRAVLERVRR